MKGHGVVFSSVRDKETDHLSLELESFWVTSSHIHRSLSYDPPMSWAITFVNSSVVLLPLSFFHPSIPLAFVWLWKCDAYTGSAGFHFLEVLSLFFLWMLEQMVHCRFCVLLPTFGQGLNLQLDVWSRLHPSPIELEGVGTCESYLLHLFKKKKKNLTHYYIGCGFPVNKFLWL